MIAVGSCLNTWSRPQWVDVVLKQSFSMSQRQWPARHKRLGHAFAGGEALVVPVLDRSPTFGPLPVGGPLGEQSLGVLEQQTTVALDDHHDVLVVPLAEVDEGGLEVQAIADHGVEVSVVVGKDPFQQTLGGRHFSFAGPLHFHV